MPLDNSLNFVQQAAGLANILDEIALFPEMPFWQNKYKKSLVESPDTHPYLAVAIHILHRNTTDFFTDSSML
jgi:hypothetical protein